MRRIVILTTLIALFAMPAAALAQSAGDEQYSDPFGEVDNGSGNANGNGNGNGADTQAPAPDTSTATPDSSFGTTTPETTSATTATTTSGSLPRTGLPLLVLAGAGMALMGGGTLLRSRL